VSFSTIAAMSVQSAQRFWAIVALVAIGWLALLSFFPRRIGGEGGGAEKAIVGFIWVLAAIGLAIYLFHHAEKPVAFG
jgi:Na+-transporting NADH:ubiquinone oxidoreductase subunit NqrB